MAGLASITDLTDIWRPLSDAEAIDPKFPRLLSKAEALLRQQVPHLDTRLAKFALDVTDPYGLDPSVVGSVIASIVKRFLINPSGASSQTTGPVSVSFVDRYAGKDGSASIKGGLSVTASDLAQLKPAVPAAAIGSIHVGAGLAVQRYRSGLVLENADAQAADPDSWPLSIDGQPALLAPDHPE